jgi:hypothetical protein
MRCYAWGLLAAVLVGLGAPYLELALVCHNSSSESCVWGRALLPVNIVGSLVVLGLPTFLLVVWFLGRRSHNK